LTVVHHIDFVLPITTGNGEDECPQGKQIGNLNSRYEDNFHWSNEIIVKSKFNLSNLIYPLKQNKFNWAKVGTMQVVLLTQLKLFCVSFHILDLQEKNTEKANKLPLLIHSSKKLIGQRRIANV